MRTKTKTLEQVLNIKKEEEKTKEQKAAEYKKQRLEIAEKYCEQYNKTNQLNEKLRIEDNKNGNYMLISSINYIVLAGDESAIAAYCIAAFKTAITLKASKIQNVQLWYRSIYFTDDTYTEINPATTFEALAKEYKKNEDNRDYDKIYSILTGDSVIRERTEAELYRRKLI